MKQIHLRTFLILNLCLAALTACKKLNYVDPDIKKPDIVNMSTQVKRIEVFEKLDTTHHTLSYRSDGTLDSLVTEVYQNGALKSKVLRTFKEDVGKLLKEEVFHLHPSSSYSSTKYEYEGAKIKREITESETRTYYYDQNGFMDYILSSKGDSIDVVQSPGLLETAVYSKRLIDDGETQLESWDVFGRSNWELKSDTIYYSTSGNGSGETKYVMYSNIKNPIAKHAWCYIGGFREGGFVHAPDWAQNDRFEDKIQSFSRYRPVTSFTYHKDDLGRVNRIDVVLSTSTTSQPSTLNLFY